MGKTIFFDEGWDDEEIHQDMLEKSYDEVPVTYKPDSSYKEYTKWQIRDCNIVAISILRCNKNYIFPTVLDVVNYMAYLMDPVDVFEAIEILKKTRFLYEPALKKGRLRIPIAKRSGLEKLEEGFPYLA